MSDLAKEYGILFVLIGITFVVALLITIISKDGDNQ